jgi:hypothetical protein
MNKQKHLIRQRGRPPHEFANKADVDENDSPVLPSPVLREEGPAEGDEPSDFQTEVDSHPVGGQPLSEVTGGPQGGTPDETEDGLGEVEEALRRAAETPPGRQEKL